MYVEEAETRSDLCVPPPDSAVVGIWSKNGVVYYHQVVKVHHVTYKNMQFDQSILWMHIIEPYPIVKTSNYQLLSYDVTSIDANLVTSYLVLIPKEYQLILIPGNQNWTQNKSHSNRFFMITVMLYNYIQGISFE